jgi:hypothetical protein
VPRVHAVCYHNEASALRQRLLGPTPRAAIPGRHLLRKAFRKIRRVADRYGAPRWDYRATALSYTGVLRRRYLEAERSIVQDGPISSGDTRLRAFLKAEKRTRDNLAKPRMIFPRTPRYNLVLASWLKPFEHWLWGNLKSVGTRGVAKTRVVAKGLNPTQRANLIRRKFSSFGDCVVFEVDGKAFEAHQDDWQLRQEHAVYMRAYPGDVDLRRMLQKQLFNFGRTQCGLRFARSGGRASGDFNTGMGNTILMLSIVEAALRDLDIPKFDTLVDGDNALIFIRRSDCQRVVQQFAPTVLKLSGHEMTVENPVDHLEGVCFGQSHPVHLGGGRWRMVRDWRKVLSQGTSSHIHLREPSFAREFLQGVSLCELHLGSGVPILGRWAESLRQATEIHRPVRMHPHRDYEAMGLPLSVVQDAKYSEPTPEARLSFERAFGVAPDRQRTIESLLASGPGVLQGFQHLLNEEIGYREAMALGLGV